MKLFRPVNGADWKYKDAADKAPAVAPYLCPVCKGPWMDPMTHTECGSTFCHACISGEQCPVCKLELGVLQTIPIRASNVLAAVESLPVECPSCSNSVIRKKAINHWNHCPLPCPQGCGIKVAPLLYTQHRDTSCSQSVITCPLCQTQGKRSVITSAEHKDSCPVACPNGCTQKVAPKDFAAHNSTCPEALVACSRCKTQVKRGKFMTDHVPACPVPCACGDLVAPKDMDTHLKSGCRMAPVPCSGSTLMCPWTGPRPHLDAHEKSCRFLAIKDILTPLLEIMHGAGMHLSSNSKGKNLAGVDLSRKVMRGWTLAGSDLHGANLEMSDLSNADLTGANLSGANLTKCRLKNAILAGADLSGAILNGSTLKKADLSKCNLKNARLQDCDLTGATTTLANFEKAWLVGVKKEAVEESYATPDKVISAWPRNKWKQMPSLDIVFSNNNLTVSNTSNGTQCTFADIGIPLGAVVTWKIKVNAADCSHAGCGVAIPTAQIGKGHHGDKEGCWKWQCGGLTVTNGTNTDSSDKFGAGDTLTLYCDRRTEPTIFTIAKGDREVKRFQIRTRADLIPFVAACCRGNNLTAEFNIPQPLSLDLQGVEGMDTATLIDPNGPAEAEPLKPVAAASAAQSADVWTENRWKKQSQHNAEFTNNDLTLKNTTNTTQTVMSVIPVKPGCVRYWEVKVLNQSCEGCGFGVVHEDRCEAVLNTHADSDRCWKWEAGSRYYENGNRLDGGKFITGDVIGILCDRRPGQNTITFFKNGELAKVLQNLPESSLLYPSITPCCTNVSFTTDFAAPPPASVNIPELRPGPPPPPPVTIDTNLWPKDTWNRIEGIELDFTNNSLTVTNPARRTQSTTSLYGIPMNGARYWEVAVDAAHCPACGVGVSLDGAPVGMGHYADKAACWKWEALGRFIANGVVMKHGTGFVEGDVLGIYVSRAAGKGTVTFYKNGTEVYTLSGLPEDPAVIVMPTVTPCCENDSFTGRFNAPMPEVLGAALEAEAAKSAKPAAAKPPTPASNS